MDKAAAAMQTLRRYRDALTRRQIKTIAGQIRSGDIPGAIRGLSGILLRQSYSMLGKFCADRGIENGEQSDV